MVAVVLDRSRAVASGSPDANAACVTAAPTLIHIISTPTAVSL